MDSWVLHTSWLEEFSEDWLLLVSPTACMLCCRTQSQPNRTTGPALVCKSLEDWCRDWCIFLETSPTPGWLAATCTLCRLSLGQPPQRCLQPSIPRKCTGKSEWKVTGVLIMVKISYYCKFHKNVEPSECINGASPGTLKRAWVS